MKIGRALPTAAVALVAGIAAVALIFRGYEAAYTSVAHTSDVRLVLGRSIGRISDFNERGCSDLRGDVAEFAGLTRDNPVQQGRLGELARGVEIACAGRGRDEILRGLGSADEEERNLLLVRRGKLEGIRRWALVALVFAMIAALSIVAVGFRIQRRALEIARAAALHLEKIAVTDELTKLYNRRGFLFVASPAHALARRQKKDAALVYADLDGLKKINDQLGHGEGDRALSDFGGLLRATFRSTDVVARLGGDEFVAFLADVDSDRLSTIEARIQYALSTWNEHTTGSVRLSASIGIARVVPGDARSLDELVQAADTLMYANKRARREHRTTTPSIDRHLG